MYFGACKYVGIFDHISKYFGVYLGRYLGTFGYVEVNFGTLEV